VAENPLKTDLRRPRFGPVYLSLLNDRSDAATHSRSRPLPCDKIRRTSLPAWLRTSCFDPAAVDRDAAGKNLDSISLRDDSFCRHSPRHHKGIKPLAKIVAQNPGAQLAVFLPRDDWR